MMQSIPWFESQPEWYKEELDSLTHYGIVHELDEKLKSQGILSLYLTIQPDNPYFSDLGIEEELKLIAQYPDTFPFFRPEITAPNLNLVRHQNPVQKNLCLLPRDTLAWNPSQSIGSYLSEQLPKVFLKGNETDLDKIKTDPLEQAEPISEFYVTKGAPPILFKNLPYDLDGLGPHPSLVGKVVLGIPQHLQYFEVLGRDGEITTSLKQQYFKSSIVEIFYINNLPGLRDNRSIQEAIIRELKSAGISVADNRFTLSSDTKVKGIFGICFPEEKEKGKRSLGLFFLSHLHTQSRGKTKHEHVFHKVEFTQAEELQHRIPHLTPLRDKTVFVIGLGALGAPSVIEFAKAGVKKIHILDFDTVDVGPTVRWPLGMQAVGMLKGQAIKSFINANYPHVKIEVHHKRIGSVRNPESESENEFHFLENLAKESHLIYDASVEHSVHHILSLLASRHSTAYVLVSATPGIWGGSVVSLEPGKTKGCYMCYVEAKGDGTIPIPPSDPKGELQAPGCGDLSFTGTGFDLMNIISTGVRVSVGILCKDETNGYEVVEKDVRILSLRGKNHEPILPDWFTLDLQVHHGCAYCNS